MAMPEPLGGSIYHQLKVTLLDIAPPIWRRVQVESDTTLERLHQIIQIAMGWENYHLYQFAIGGREYGEPDREFGMPRRSSSNARLSRVAPDAGDSFLYLYDFGDSWEHEILVESIAPVDPEVRYPICVAGERACPPEDCGGIWGYSELLEALRDPQHEQHEEMTEWVGGSFDPEAFDLEAVNRALGSLGSRARARRAR